MFILKVLSALLGNLIIFGALLFLPAWTLIVFEEQFLRQELDGYNAYTEQVRYKLLPHVW